MAFQTSARHPLLDEAADGAKEGDIANGNHHGLLAGLAKRRTVHHIHRDDDILPAPGQGEILINQLSDCSCIHLLKLFARLLPFACLPISLAFCCCVALIHKVIFEAFFPKFNLAGGLDLPAICLIGCARTFDRSAYLFFAAG